MSYERPFSDRRREEIFDGREYEYRNEENEPQFGPNEASPSYRRRYEPSYGAGYAASHPFGLGQLYPRELAARRPLLTHTGRSPSGGGYGEYNWEGWESYGRAGSPSGPESLRDRPPSGEFTRGYGTAEGTDFGRQSYAGSYGFGSMRRGRYTGKGPKGYRRSDERIKEQVSERLEESGDVDASEITVLVSSGEVTLEGAVQNRWMKRLAEDVVEDCPGVKQVHNRLRVERKEGNGGLRSSSSHSDEKGSRSRSSV